MYGSEIHNLISLDIYDYLTYLYEVLVATLIFKKSHKFLCILNVPMYEWIWMVWVIFCEPWISQTSRLSMSRSCRILHPRCQSYVKDYYITSEFKCCLDNHLHCHLSLCLGTYTTCDLSLNEYILISLSMCMGINFPRLW